jgi:hypothetical protein
MPLIASCGYAKMWITNVYDSSDCFTIKGREEGKRRVV